NLHIDSKYFKRKIYFLGYLNLDISRNVNAILEICIKSVHKTSPLKKGCCWLNKNVKIQEASTSFQKLQFENVYALGG
ncbi:hypothetical protein, partial [Coprococcus eutactus]|uniref:hypothetical protein n=1 Tax=Coprococcus eutactus TaxID=33043 RepID=UPI0021088200